MSVPDPPISPDSDAVQLQPAPSCFVIGPIGDRFARPSTGPRETYEEALQVLEEVILPAAASVALEPPVRSDGLARAGEITEQIFRRLRDADVVIADLTDANPNVMYELGLRHSRNAITLQIGEYGRLPFDVSVIRTVQFSRSSYGLIQARNELVSLLETALAGDFDPVSATRIWQEVGSAPSSEDPHPSVSPAGEPDEEPGWMDQIAESERLLAEVVVPQIESIGDLVARIGPLSESAVERMTQRDEAGGGMRDRLAVLASYAEELKPIATMLEAETAAYAQSMDGIDAGIIAMIDLFEAHHDQIPGALPVLQSIRGFAATTRGSVAITNALMATIADTGRASRVLRESTRRILAALSTFCEHASKSEEWDRRLHVLGVPPPESVAPEPG